MSSNLVWIDLEMTGLDPSHDRIIEMATIVTDSDLNVVAEGPVLAISQPQALLEGMDEVEKMIATKKMSPSSPEDGPGMQSPEPSTLI